jgi:hypothetical protein
MNYQDFLETKDIVDKRSGFEPLRNGCMGWDFWRSSGAK